MHWFERRIRQYEHRRWTTDDNRRVMPFDWGLEHIGGDPQAADPAGFVREYSKWAIEHSREWYACTPAPDYALDAEGVLTFTSSIESAWPENNTVHAQFFPAGQKGTARDWAGVDGASNGAGAARNGDRAERNGGLVASESRNGNSNAGINGTAHRSSNGNGNGSSNETSNGTSNGTKLRPAVVLLPNWNAKWHGQRGLCEWLQRIGVSVLRLSLPYHDRRMAKGHERADQLVGPNIGLTLQANRQAVQDTRRCLRWLEQQGFNRLGILGTSIGSSVGYITLVHDDALRAGGFFHVSTHFADVVSRGMTTTHVWEGLRGHVTVDELREFWAPVSPMPYVERGMGKGKNAFMVYGKYDPTFLPELTEQMLAALRKNDAAPGPGAALRALFAGAGAV